MIINILKTMMMFGSNPLEKVKEATRVFLTPFTYIAWLIVAFLCIDLYFVAVNSNRGDKTFKNDMVYIAVESFWYAFASLVWIPIIDTGRFHIKKFIELLLTTSTRQNISFVDVSTMILLMSLYIDTKIYINGSILFIIYNWVLHRYVQAPVIRENDVRNGIRTVQKLEQICENIYGMSNKVPNYHIRRKFYRILNKYSIEEFNKSPPFSIMPVTVTIKTDPDTVGNHNQRPLVRVYDEIGNVRVMNDKSFHQCTLRSVDEWDLIDKCDFYGNSIVECRYKAKNVDTYMVESEDKIFIMTTSGE